MSYGTPYQATPIKPVRVGRVKMTKTTNTPEVTKPAKKYNKTRGEHYKDILIAMLITGIIAFVCGMHFSNQQNSRISAAVKAVAAPSASAQSVKPASK